MRKRPALGLFFPDREGELLSGEWCVKWKGKGTRELKMPDITEEGYAYWKNERRALGASWQNCFILQNRHAKNCILQGCPVCYWVSVIDPSLVIQDRWPDTPGKKRMSFWKLQAHKRRSSQYLRPELRKCFERLARAQDFLWSLLDAAKDVDLVTVTVDPNKRRLTDPSSCILYVSMQQSAKTYTRRWEVNKLLNKTVFL